MNIAVREGQQENGPALFVIISAGGVSLRLSRHDATRLAEELAELVARWAR